VAIHVRVAIVAFALCDRFRDITLYASNTDAKRDSHQNERGIKKGKGTGSAGWERRRNDLRSGSTWVNDTTGREKGFKDDRISYR